MRYVALLRGINVGGKNKVVMSDLKRIVAGLGFEAPATYVNSGNIGFDTAKTDDRKLATKIAEAIKIELGLDISVMVRSRDEIVAIVAANPFIGQFDDDKDVHVFFLNEPLTAAQETQLLATASETEFISVNGRTIYYMLKISIIDSTLGKGFIDKRLKVATTARNWRTTQKLAEL